jgi:hypothetical protein
MAYRPTFIQQSYDRRRFAGTPWQPRGAASCKEANCNLAAGESCMPIPGTSPPEFECVQMGLTARAGMGAAPWGWRGTCENDEDCADIVAPKGCRNFCNHSHPGLTPRCDQICDELTARVPTLPSPPAPSRPRMHRVPWPRPVPPPPPGTMPRPGTPTGYRALPPGPLPPAPVRPSALRSRGVGKPKRVKVAPRVVASRPSAPRSLDCASECAARLPVGSQAYNNCVALCNACNEAEAGSFAHSLCSLAWDSSYGQLSRITPGYGVPPRPPLPPVPPPRGGTRRGRPPRRSGIG